MWWHNEVYDINELDYLLTSSSSCNCEYGCATSPTNIYLPTNDGTYRGVKCSTGCPQSFNVDFECIKNSKAECKYGLYDQESDNRLF
jgi:hypothetical protein